MLEVVAVGRMFTVTASWAAYMDLCTSSPNTILKRYSRSLWYLLSLIHLFREVDNNWIYKITVLPWFQYFGLELSYVDKKCYLHQWNHSNLSLHTITFVVNTIMRQCTNKLTVKLRAIVEINLFLSAITHVTSLLVGKARTEQFRQEPFRCW